MTFRQVRRFVHRFYPVQCVLRLYPLLFCKDTDLFRFRLLRLFPVSYTHLDVYKRQVSGYSVKNCYFLKDTASMPYAENSGTGLEVKTENHLADMTETLGSAFVKSDKFPVLAWDCLLYTSRCV